MTPSLCYVLPLERRVQLQLLGALQAFCAVRVKGACLCRRGLRLCLRLCYRVVLLAQHHTQGSGQREKEREKERGREGERGSSADPGIRSRFPVFKRLRRHGPVPSRRLGATA
jgi:hypothetical protein